MGPMDITARVNVYAPNGPALIAAAHTAAAEFAPGLPITSLTLETVSDTTGYPGDTRWGVVAVITVTIPEVPAP